MTIREEGRQEGTEVLIIIMTMREEGRQEGTEVLIIIMTMRGEGRQEGTEVLIIIMTCGRRENTTEEVRINSSYHHNDTTEVLLSTMSRSAWQGGAKESPSTQ
jgi:hypothetical protein